jgi:hypothetical protein
MRRNEERKARVENEDEGGRERRMENEEEGGKGEKGGKRRKEEWREGWKMMRKKMKMYGKARGKGEAGWKRKDEGNF